MIFSNVKRCLRTGFREGLRRRILRREFSEMYESERSPDTNVMEASTSAEATTPGDHQVRRINIFTDDEPDLFGTPQISDGVGARSSMI